MLGQPRLSLGDPFVDPLLDLIRRGDAEIPKPRRDVGGDAHFAADELAVVGRQDEFPIDICLDGGSRVFDCQAVVMRRVVREGNAAELTPFRHAEFLLEGEAHRQAGRLAAVKREAVVVAIGVVAEDDSGHVVERERLHLGLDRVVPPLGVTGDEERTHDRGLVVHRVLFQIRRAFLVADGPGIEVADRVGPWSQGHAPVRQVVVFLDRAVELTEGPGQPSARVPREVVPEEVGTPAGQTQQCDDESPSQGHGRLALLDWLTMSGTSPFRGSGSSCAVEPFVPAE